MEHDVNYRDYIDVLNQAKEVSICFYFTENFCHEWLLNFIDAFLDILRWPYSFSLCY
jgi:hypothetical protein